MQTVQAIASRVGPLATKAASAAGSALKSDGFTLLQGAASGFSAMYDMAGSKAQADALAAEAGDENLRANQEFIDAQRRSTEISRRLLDVVGTQRANAAAAGIDVGSGSVIAAENLASDEADRQISIERGTAMMNAAMRRARAQQLVRAAGLTKSAGLAKGLGGILETVIDVARRGGPSKSEPSAKPKQGPAV